MVLTSFARDRVGQSDRGIVPVGIGLAADRQLAAAQVDPVGLEPEIAIVGKAELAVDRSGCAAPAAATSRTTVHVARDRHRIAGDRHLAVGQAAGSDQRAVRIATAGAAAAAAIAE
jgi:hypothetical protein